METARALGDTDGGFERLLRARLEDLGAPGDVALARELHFHDGRQGAIVPQHELDIALKLTDGSYVIEAKAWQNVVDKEPIMVFLAKVLDFLVGPRFDTVADSLKVGFIGLAGFTEPARRIMFSFGMLPFSQKEEDLSFRFLDLRLANLQVKFADAADAVMSTRSLISPFVNFERRKLTSILRIDGDQAVVDLAALRRGASLYDEARLAHAEALDHYRRLTKRFAM
jgi:hypothetical protein